ncbi:hypothetical protein [Bradyrhizobium sp. 27S5]|uniref:hypothetical protein n=1 Tax=Bradyrhizobium sp. 27S5 TaxID=3139728 RepID=UPI0039C87EA5
MASKPKTYVALPGFYDQAIAAPSMKAALEAWGADSNLFHQGVAKETYDPEIVAATMAQSGVILKRPVGSNAAFGDFRPSYRSGSSRESGSCALRSVKCPWRGRRR